jgi:hypothetical protein
MKTREILFFLVLWVLLVTTLCAQPTDRVSRQCKTVPPPTFVRGSTEVCFGNSILLEATPTNERYYLSWEPLDTNSTFPAFAEGNRVTFSYDYKAINGIAVRQIDKVTGCRSEAYIHPVDTFSLSNGDIPCMMTVYEGDRFRLELPDQSKHVVYEWITSDRAASIVGDNFVPSVEVSVNYLNNGSESRYPHRTYVTLKRKCSNGAEYRHSVILSIEKAAVAHEVPSVVSSDAHPAPVIDTIIAPTRMCEERPAMFQAVASGENLRYRWDFGDGTFNYGNPVYHSYNVRSMTHITVTLTVTDTFGRTDTGQTYLVVRENKMDDGFLHTMYAETSCSESGRVLGFSPPLTVNDYYWKPLDTVTVGNMLTVRQTGNYIVDVRERYGNCRTNSIINVAFRNVPVAEIVGDTLCKMGRKVRLVGNTGTRNTYLWSIMGPEKFSFTSPNIVFKPRKTGIYRVHLMVISPDGCAAEKEARLAVRRQGRQK